MMRKKIFTAAVGIFLTMGAAWAQVNSFILMGDIHYDKLSDHDFAWLTAEKAGDLSQIEGYTANVSKNWDDFMKHLRYIVKTNPTPIRAVVQLGDLSEGLAGDAKADQIAKSAVSAVEKSKLGIPWIIAKGNHDVTSGSAAKTAFIENYIPLFQRQTGNPNISSANYSYRVGESEFFICDYYERSSVDVIAWLDAAVKASNARYKFACFHEPVIPVTERCWHMYRTENENRERLLQTIAENKLIVLTGHLHRYSVVRRMTQWGPIVQIMSSSVISSRNAYTPSKMNTVYGPSLAEDVPSYEPATLEQRKAYLQAEQPFVTFYKQCSLQGFSLLSVDENTHRITLKYYAGFNCEAYDSVDISELLN